MSKVSNQDCLTASEFQAVSVLFVNSFDLGIEKLITNKVKNIEQVCLQLLTIYQTNELHTLLSSQGLEDITNKVFSDTDLRDFILNITSRMNVLISFSDFQDRSIQYTLAYGLTTERAIVSQSVMPKQVRDQVTTLYTLKEIESLLYSNDWLVTIILIILFLDQTKFFAIEETKPVKKTAKVAVPAA